VRASNKDGSGGLQPDKRPTDAVCLPLDTTIVRVSGLNRAELKSAVASLLDAEAPTADPAWNLYAPAGSPVYSVTGGVVRQVNSWRRRISLIVELHSSPAMRLANSYGARRLIAVYEGLDDVAVAVGDAVAAGDIIASVAASASTPPHLRFELRTSLRGGRRIDPKELIGSPEKGRGAACGSDT